MTSIKSLVIVLLISIFNSCDNNTKKKLFSLKTNTTVATKKNKTFYTISNSETLAIEIKNPKKRTITSTQLSLDGKTISKNTVLNTFKLGIHTLKAEIKHSDGLETLELPITIVNSKAPKIYTFKIINTYPHDITAYTQGLEFYNGILYESTGQRGKSKLRAVDYKTGKVLKNIDLEQAYFGEGLTVLHNKIYQLTWQSGKGFVYDLESFTKESSFKFGKSKEGWGLCNDQKQLYKSDGTENIWILDPKTLTEQDRIQVYTNKGKIGRLNELEWVNNMIYSNIYQRDGVAVINPKNGATEAIIDFSALKKKVKQHPKLDVLNGIAYNPNTKTVFVTGKHWDKLFEVEIIKN